MRNILTIAHLTLEEARRRRVAAAAVLCGAAFLSVFATAVFFGHNGMVASDRLTSVARQAFLTMLTLGGLYASNFLSVLFAVLLPVDTLSGEIDSGVMQTLASKPIRRAEIVIGKWLGHAVMVVGYLLLLSLGVVAAMWIVSGDVPVNLEIGLPLMALQAVLLMTVSIAGGTRFTTITNGVLALGFYGIAFVGGWIEQVGALAGVEAVRTVGIVASLISPTDALWRLASYHLQPAIVRDLAPLIFTVAAAPTSLMVWWAGGFTIAVLAWAVRSFERRAL